MKIPNIRLALKFCLIPTLVLLWTLTPKLGFGDLNEWSLLGLEDESVWTLVILPENPNIMIAGSPHIFMEPNTGGIFRSTDSGAIWDTVALRGIGVKQIIIAPGNSYTLYAATDDGVYRSYDRGVSWNLVTRYGLGSWIYGNTVAVDPLDSLHLLWGTGGQGGGWLSTSEDGGDNWYTLEYGVFEGVTYDPISPDYAFAWSSIWGCMLSTDHGHEWNSWLFRDSGMRTVTPSRYNNRVWICSDSLLWTDDMGQSWSATMTGTTGYLSSLVQGFLNDSSVAVGTYGGAYYIQDVLGEWEYLNQGGLSTGCMLLNILPDQSTLLASFMGGIWEYTYQSNSVQDQILLSLPPFQVYPNPFVDRISFSLPPGKWEISLFNILGQKIAHNYINTQQQIGIQPWQLGDLSSGSYFLLVQSIQLINQEKEWVTVIQKLR